MISVHVTTTGAIFDPQIAGRIALDELLDATERAEFHLIESAGARVNEFRGTYKEAMHQEWAPGASATVEGVVEARGPHAWVLEKGWPAGKRPAIPPLVEWVDERGIGDGTNSLGIAIAIANKLRASGTSPGRIQHPMERGLADALPGIDGDYDEAARAIARRLA